MVWRWVHPRSTPTNSMGQTLGSDSWGRWNDDDWWLMVTVRRKASLWWARVFCVGHMVSLSSLADSDRVFYILVILVRFNSLQPLLCYSIFIRTFHQSRSFNIHSFSSVTRPCITLLAFYYSLNPRWFVHNAIFLTYHMETETRYIVIKLPDTGELSAAEW